MKFASSAVGVGFVAAVTIGLALPGSAGADPLNDLLCNSGSAQFCPPPAPVQPLLPPPPPEQPTPPPPPAQSAPVHPPTPSTGYKNCTEAWNAGVAPLHRNDPGYAPKLDRDNDGIACEKDPR